MAVAERYRSVDTKEESVAVHAFARSFLGSEFDQRRSAVLVALFEEEGATRVILTVRSPRLRSHSGEVAFPGGRLDPGETVIGAALREAAEEVGLVVGPEAVVGTLSPMLTVASNSVMTPVVVALAGRPSVEPAPAEVSRVFDVALTDLLEEAVFAEEHWSVPGRPGADGTPGGEFPVWFYRVGGEVIWGATARVLTELCCLATGVTAPAARFRPGLG